MSEEKYLYHLRNGINIIEGLNFTDQKGRIKKLLIDCITSKNLNVLIGSGCSVPAVPLMGITFKKIKEDYLHLNFGKFDGDSPDIEGYLNWLMTGLNFLNNSAEEKSKEIETYKEAFDITKKELLESIIKKYEDDLEDSQKKVKDNYIKFYNAIFSIRRRNKDNSPPNIFTTNYDLFNEVALEYLGIHYTNGFRGSVKRIFDPTVFNLRLVDDQKRYKEKWSIIRNYFKLYKVHGSIDWEFIGSEIVQKDPNSIDAENAVIYPTISKHFETQQTPYSELFRALSISLQKPDSTLLVLGYGFPDEHINQLITQSLSNKDFTLVVFGNKKEEKAEAFLNKYQNNDNLHFIGGTIKENGDGHHFSNVIDYLVGDSI